MSLWTRVRGAGTIAAAVIVCLGFAWLAEGRVSQAPSVVGTGRSAFIWSAYASLLPGLVLARGLESRRHLHERRSRRPTATMDAALVLTTVAVLALGAAAIGAPDQVGELLVRNAIGIPLLCTGVGLWAGPARAAAVALTVLIATQSFAPNAHNARFVRMFQLEASHDGWTILCACLTISVLVSLSAAPAG